MVRRTSLSDCWRWSGNGGVGLVGSGGLLRRFTKNVVETGLDAELTERLGHDRGGTPIGENMRNGTRTKTVRTEVGQVGIGVSRDRDGLFDRGRA